ncbi:MAG: hypothetical protein KGJ07_01030 [Patescibacteria group bacterium]|nr:hypothetical protein [Patescibacteria group bacterium]MDE2590827.1 hypothetical protein [Patescibacteria group bacterium]
MAKHPTASQPQDGSGRERELYKINRSGQPLPRGPLQIALGRLQEFMINHGDQGIIPDVIGFLSETTSVLENVQATARQGQRVVIADEDENRGLTGTNSPLPREFQITRADVRLMDLSRLRSVLAELAGPGNHRSRLWNPQTQTWIESTIPPLETINSDNIQDASRSNLATLRQDLTAYRTQEETRSGPKQHITIDLVQIGDTEEVKSMGTVMDEHLADEAKKRGEEVPHITPRYVDNPNQRELYMIVRIPGKNPKTQYAIVFTPFTLGAVYIYPPQPDGLTPEQRRSHPSKPYFRPELIALLEDSYNVKTGNALVVVPNESFIEPELRRGLRTLGQRISGQPIPDIIDDALFQDPYFHDDSDFDGTDSYKKAWIRADHFNLSFK